MKVSQSLLSVLAATGTLASPLLQRQDQSKVLIDSSLFPTLQRYTRFSVASLATFVYGGGKCPSPPFNAPVIATVNNAITDTQAAIFRDDAAKELILSLPGTSSVQDFLTDFSYIPVSYPGCTGCQVHVGFYSSWQSIANQTTAFLTQFSAQYPDYTITVTGHSLGGALAGLAYPALKATTLPVKKCYTFGQPRVGNQAFADYIDTLSGTTQQSIGDYLRTTHHTDGVPNLPGRAMGFEHSRTEFYELDDATANNTQTAASTYRCFGQEAADCNLGAAMGFINQDHLMYTGIDMTNGKQCGL